MTILLLITGLIALLGGAEILVQGAVSLSNRFRVPPLIVGLTVVAFGTGSPELAVSLSAVWADQPDLTVGNVIGSNIVNILVVLGVAATMSRIPVSSQLRRWDIPIMIGVTLLTVLLAANGTIGWLEGLLFVIIGGVYIGLTIRLTRNTPSETECADARSASPPGRALPIDLGRIIVGLGLLVLGSQWLVIACTEIATLLGVSELIIGLTVVALGTSLPEVATTVVATLRGHADLAVGNVVGSNIFNILWVIGMTGLLSPVPLAIAPDAIAVDMPVMLLTALVCIPIFYGRPTMIRIDGLYLLGLYGLYAIALWQMGTRGSLSTGTIQLLSALAAGMTVVIIGTIFATGAPASKASH